MERLTLGYHPSVEQIIAYLAAAEVAANPCCVDHFPEALGVLQARVLIAVTALRLMEVQR